MSARNDLWEVSERNAISILALQVVVPFALARRWPSANDIGRSLASVPEEYRVAVDAEVRSILASAQAIEAEADAERSSLQ